jgi:hypothetical protein
MTPGLQKLPSLFLAIVGATGISGRTAYRVPALLMPDQIKGRSPTDLVELRRLEDDRIDQAECFRVAGKAPVILDTSKVMLQMGLGGRGIEAAEDGLETWWIDKATFLVLRIDEPTKLETFRTVKTVVTYESRFDAPISQEQLDFRPPDP